MPFTQVTMFQNIAPASAPKTTAGRDQILVDQPLADRVGDLCSAGHCSARK